MGNYEALECRRCCCTDDDCTFEPRGKVEVMKADNSIGMAEIPAPAKLASDEVYNYAHAHPPGEPSPPWWAHDETWYDRDHDQYSPDVALDETWNDADYNQESPQVVPEPWYDAAANGADDIGTMSGHKVEDALTNPVQSNEPPSAMQHPDAEFHEVFLHENESPPEGQIERPSDAANTAPSRENESLPEAQIGKPSRGTNQALSREDEAHLEAQIEAPNHGTNQKTSWGNQSFPEAKSEIPNDGTNQAASRENESFPEAHLEVPNDRTNSFFVNVTREGDFWDILGLLVSPDDDPSHLVIDEVMEQPSLISNWNRTAPKELQVCQGQVIVSVNGIGGSSCDMMEVIRKSKKNSLLTLEMASREPIIDEHE